VDSAVRVEKAIQDTILSRPAIVPEMKLSAPLPDCTWFRNLLSQLLGHLINIFLPRATEQTPQRNAPCQRQPHIGPHPNSHAHIIMAIQLIMLIRANARRDVMKHGGRNHRLHIRQGAARFRRPSRRHSVCEGHKDQGERNQAPAVVAHVVELEIVGGKVGLGGRAEPADDHDGVVDPAEAAEAVPECCAVGVGVEDLRHGGELAIFDGWEEVITVEFMVAMKCWIEGVIRSWGLSGREKQSISSTDN